jgi:hypothetical protein
MAKIAARIENGYFDCLDKVDLKQGDLLFIRWPAGSVEKVTVQLELATRGELVDGQVVEVPCHKAFILVPVFGGVAKVYLLGFEAQRA